MPADIYWIGVIAVGCLATVAAIIAVVSGVAFLLEGRDYDEEDTVRVGARLTLAALPVGALVTFAWPLVVPTALGVAVVWLWRQADLPTLRRRKRLTDQAYIARLERELGIGDHDAR